jgi:hypothetical protein
MFDVLNGGTFRSPGVIQRRWGNIQYHNKDLTRVFYDPEDYWTAGGTLPHDAHLGFLRVSDIAPDGTVGSEGPIFIIPPPNFFSNPRPRLTVVGTAPNVAGRVDLLPPADAMHFVLPRFADYVDIYNRGANPIYVAFGPGLNEVMVPATTERNLWDAAFTEIFVRGNSLFDMHFAIVSGEMA